LYKTLWDAVSNTWAPVSGGRGGSAISDFLADKTLTLPRSLGRVLGSAGGGAGIQPSNLGELRGVENDTTVLNANNLPPHSHTYNTIIQGGATMQSGSGVTFTTGETGPGPGTAEPILTSTYQPTSYVNFFIKL